MEFICGRCGAKRWSYAELADHMEMCPAEQEAAIPRTPAGTLDVPAMLGYRPVTAVVEESTCRGCGSDVDPGFLEVEESRRQDYAREYLMSGLCRQCQDEVFAPAPEDEEYNQGEMP